MIYFSISKEKASLNQLDLQIENLILTYIKAMLHWSSLNIYVLFLLSIRMFSMIF